MNTVGPMFLEQEKQKAIVAATAAAVPVTAPSGIVTLAT